MRKRVFGSRKLLCQLSKIVPLRLKKVKVDKKRSIKLYLYKRQLKLQYGRVLYSDGTEYFPFKMAFSKMKTRLSEAENVLVLGAGIGSVGMMLHDKFPGKQWQMHFVDISKPILETCSSVMDWFPNVNGEYTQADAFEFIKNKPGKKYDLVCIDVFNEDRVPQEILSEKFVHGIKQVLNDSSSVVMNVMFEDEDQQEDFEQVLTDEFSVFDRLEKEQNSIYILPANN
ncbi:MAG: hypothetical protein JNM21_12105 [Taibaiella sp.]|nr:hypothetical protein [Taibaiella sp.]